MSFFSLADMITAQKWYDYCPKMKSVLTFGKFGQKYLTTLFIKINNLYIYETRECIPHYVTGILLECIPIKFHFIVATVLPGFIMFTLIHKIFSK